MTVASDLSQRHIETLLSPGEWEALIADDILWELPFAPAPCRALMASSEIRFAPHAAVQQVLQPDVLPADGQC
jgi:hypothetical protein